ncbi:hypothetical protein ES705_50574 [subsurface metagenome]
MSSKSIEIGSIDILLFKNSITSQSELTGNTFSSLIIPASLAFASGTSNFILSFIFAIKAMGSTPLTGFILPSKDNSPIIRYSFNKSGLTCLLATKIAKAIDRSKIGPSFLISAGARFTVILCMGNSNSEFFMAALTLSRDS